MKTSTLVSLLAILGAAGTGYWLGGQPHDAMKVGVTAGNSLGAGEAATASTAPAGGKKLLYYRNPMGLPDTSPTPKKDSMGMDYIPVYEGEDDDDGGSVKISTAKVQKLGVRVEAAALRDLSRPVRAVGRVEVDERRTYAVAPKFEGWIERLHVNTTGQVVGRGQPLFEVYSPELVSAQREYQVAARGIIRLAGAAPEAQASMRQVAESSLSRLRNWDISEEQVKALAEGGEPRRTMTFRSQASGVIMEKKAVQGMRFMPGEALYQIADISGVWVIADVFERDLAAVKLGQTAIVTTDAFPERTYTGKVAYLYPTVNPQTRTVPVRIELANPGGLLRPAMYANVDLKVGAGGTAAPVVTVPISAVIDSGTKQRIIVQKDAGRFEPRDVKLGLRGDDYVEVREGVQAGEKVVVSANFLIDSESNLKAALGGMKEPEKATVSHHAVGTLDSIESDGSVMVTHAPVASLNWPQMTMGFVPANPALLQKLKPGTPIHFEFVERQPGEWVITKIEKKAP